MRSDRLWIAGGLVAGLAVTGGAVALFMSSVGPPPPPEAVASGAASDTMVARAPPAAPPAAPPPAPTEAAQLRSPSLPETAARSAGTGAPAPVETPPPSSRPVETQAAAPASAVPAVAPVVPVDVPPPSKPTETPAAAPANAAPPVATVAPAMPVEVSPPKPAATPSAEPAPPTPVETRPAPAKPAAAQATAPAAAEPPAETARVTPIEPPPAPARPAAAQAATPPAAPTPPAEASEPAPAHASPAPAAPVEPPTAATTPKAAETQASPSVEAASKPAQTALTVLPPAALTRVVAEAVAPLGCALLSGRVDDRGQIVLAGVIARDAAPILHRILLDSASSSQIDWRVTPLAGPYCRTLDALRIAAPPFGSSTGALDLGLRNGAKPLSKDAFIIPVLRTPDFPSALTLDYFASDGSVSHLAFAAPPGLLPPSRSFSVGDPHPDDPAANLASVGTPGWQVDAPYGTDLIVGIASDQPLFAKARPEGERPEDYVKALRAALEATVRRGGRLALAVVPLETTER